MIWSFTLSVAVSVAPAPASTAVCMNADLPRHDFQVEQPASYVRDTALIVAPAGNEQLARRSPRRVFVMFVVNSLGVPDSTSLKVLQAPPGVDLALLRTVMPQWKFQPARLAGCAVAQVVRLHIDGL